MSVWSRARWLARSTPLVHQRLAEIAAGDPGESHTAAAQYLEALLVGVMGGLRGDDAAERQRRLVNRVIATLTDEMGPEWGGSMSLADPLRRLLAVHGHASGYIGSAR